MSPLRPVQPIGMPGVAPQESETAIDEQNQDQELQKQIDLTKKQKELLEAQAELQKARASLLSAGLPDVEVEAPKGEVEIKDEKLFGYLAELAAYKSVQRIAKTIAEKIDGCQEITGKAKIIIVDSLEIAQAELPLQQIKSSLQFYENVISERIALNKNILAPKKPDEKEVLPSEPVAEDIPKMAMTLSSPAIAGAIGAGLQALPAIAAVVPPVLSGAAQAFSYFKRDQTVYSREVTVPDEVLQSAVAGEIHEHAVLISNFYPVQRSALLDQYYFVAELRLRLGAQIGQLEAVKEEKSMAAGALNASQELSRAYDTYSQSVNQPQEGGLSSPLASAIFRDRIKDLGITHFLYLKIHSASGEARTKKGLWTRGGELSYLGGVALNYVLADKDGEIAAADSLSAFVEIFHTMGSRQPLELKERIL
jgi:hypothetical protein